MKKKLLLFVIFPLSLLLHAQNFPESNDTNAHERFIDIDTIRLNLKINPWEEKVSGTANISFEKRQARVDSFFIHAVNFKLESVKLNNEIAEYKYLKQGGMWIYPQNRLTDHNQITIKYSANPRKGLFFIGWDDISNRRNKQIWTQGQGIDNRHWFPSYDLQDEKAIFDLTISFPKDYKLLSNGELLSKNTDSINTVWHYQTTNPMSSYLVMIAGGEYQFSEALKDTSHTQSRIVFQYWYYNGKKDWVEPTYKFTEDIMAFFEREIGVEYPWKKYAQIPVSDFKHGAMENTTATIFSDVYFCNDSSFIDRNYISVNAHEMAHHWFGDAITCTSAKHHWLHEGFATYYQLLAIEEFIGENEYIWEKKTYRDKILQASLRNSLPMAHPKAGTERFYYKGALTLMMLEQKVGKENFKKSIKEFVESELYGVVESEDLISSFEKSISIDLRKFFDQWLYESGEPEIEVSYFENKEDRGIVFKQNSKTFNITIPIVIQHKRRSEKVYYQLNKKIDTLLVSKKIKHFEIDPKIESLANYKIKMPQAFIIHQMLYGSTSIIRYDALEIIEWRDESEKIKTFKEIDIASEQAIVLNRVYSQLKENSSSEAIKIREQILSKDNIELRKLIVSETIEIIESERPIFESFLKSKSYELCASTLNLLCENFPDKADNYLNKTKNIYGGTIAHVNLSWLYNAFVYGSFSNSDKIEFADKLVDYTSNSFEFNTRLIALSKVINLGYYNEALLLNLINGATSFNHHLVRPFRQVLSSMAKNESFYKKLNEILNNHTLSETEENYLQKLLEIKR
ncbi:MAG: hypothetical protein KAH10_09025 [Flavobacteriales bacterium]|nr:hypothetical protein [Flavobacteriales bacterium]